jgi:two-component system, chemotaxis family, protein-glutamate methylesterase/glutaminase
MVEPAANPQGAAAEGSVRRDIVMVGASAGGVEALTGLARSLPVDARIAILVVLHMPVGATSRLPEILSRAGPFPARFAAHGAVARPGFIHVAPPDRHLTLSDRTMVLRDGPRENGFRPAIDPLFRSGAQSLGQGAVGVILSGTLDDGVAGLAAIQAAGGATVIQDPGDAMCGSLPEAALEIVTPDAVAPAASIGEILASLAREPMPSRPHLVGRDATTLMADPMTLEADGVDVSCPDCGGALQEITAGSFRRYRCRVGHVLSPETLLNGKGIELEAALWAAVRTLEEAATVARRLADRSRENGVPYAARRFEARQVDAAQRADLVRQAIGAFQETLYEPTEEALAADSG